MNEVYFETGRSGDARSISITKGADVTNGRHWRFKVTLLECSNLSKYGST